MRLALMAAVGVMTALASASSMVVRAEPEVEAEAPASGYTIVDECGARVVQLGSQYAPDRMRWGEFGEIVDTYYGVHAFSHGQDGHPGRSDGTQRYQCTELVHRYLRQVYAVPSRIGLGLGNGVDLARGVAEHWGQRNWTGGVTGETPVTLRYYANGAARCRPVAGSIVSIAMPTRGGGRGLGHVAIIRALDEENGALVGVLFEQHGGADYPPDHVVRPGAVRFEQDADGVWRGTYTTDYGRTFHIEGWTNVVAP
jgi:hypothetical protein